MNSLRRPEMRSGRSVRNHTLKPDISVRRAVLSTTPTTNPRPRRTELAVHLVHACADTPLSVSGSGKGRDAAVACACRSQGRKDREKPADDDEDKPPWRTILSRRPASPQRTKKSSGMKALIDMSTMKEICPRGNNKLLFISLFHDKCLLFMLELY